MAGCHADDIWMLYGWMHACTYGVCMMYVWLDARNAVWMDGLCTNDVLMTDVWDVWMNAGYMHDVWFDGFIDAA